MLPAMLPLHPPIAKAMIHYRERTMAAALSNARAQGMNGEWANTVHLELMLDPYIN
jgi:trehalose/maltose hydrolase-like predicted phosphorylase